MSDLTVPEARDKRNSLASRTDVLDKLGVLATLPDDMHATTEMVATFYEVGVEAIKSVVKDNRHEVSSDGYHVVVGDELRSLKDLSGIDSRTPSLALFPRRAVLRVGMLLRDSSVARQVRGYLLDTEQQRPAQFEIPQTMSEALRLAADQFDRAELEAAKRRQLEAKVEHDAPKVEAYEQFLDADGTYAVGVAAKMLGTSQNKLFHEMRARRVFIAKGPMRNTPYQKYMQHFSVKAASYTREDGTEGTSYTTRVRPSGVDFMRRRLSIQLALEEDAS